MFICNINFVVTIIYMIYMAIMLHANIAYQERHSSNCTGSIFWCRFLITLLK